MPRIARIGVAVARDKNDYEVGLEGARALVADLAELVDAAREAGEALSRELP
jgi:hypothetical protein